MFKGLRNKLVLMHMGVVTLIVFVFFGTLLVVNYQHMQNNANEILRRAHRSAGRTPPPSGIVLRAQRSMPAPVFSPVITVELDENGTITHAVSTFEVEDGFYSEVVGRAASKRRDSAIIYYDSSVFKYLRSDNSIVFLDITKEMHMFTNTIYTFLWIVLPLLAVIFVISLYFANRSIKPIEETYNKQREFIADASHELKTPLAVISTNVDMLMDNAGTQQKKWLNFIKAETERMSSLTSSLLFLAKLDYIDDKTVLEKIDFSKLIEDYLLPMEAVFYESNIETNIDISRGAIVRGDIEQVRRLIGILVDNALKYTGGRIDITLEKSENNAKLTVFNTGKGIPAEELPKIWDRFYRGDKSRDSAGGFGLGLPIAKSITQKFKGSITAQSKENEWTSFILKLPLS